MTTGVVVTKGGSSGVTIGGGGSGWIPPGTAPTLAEFEELKKKFNTLMEAFAKSAESKSEHKSSREPDTAATSIGKSSKEKKSLPVDPGIELGNSLHPIVLAMLRAVGGSITLSREEMWNAYELKGVRIEVYETDVGNLIIREVTSENID